MTSKNEHIAREWAERHKRREKETGVFLDEESQAVMEYILATVEPPKPPTMADVDWDHDEHFLAEAVGESGVKIAMLGMGGKYLRGVVPDSTESFYCQKGYYGDSWLPASFIPTGRKYKLVPDEPATTDLVAEVRKLKEKCIDQGEYATALKMRDAESTLLGVSEPLPEPKDCKPGEYYLVRLDNKFMLAAERQTSSPDYPWGTTECYTKDERIEILARLTPDREVK